MEDISACNPEILVAERVYRWKPVSGETTLDVEHKIMKLYCGRNRRGESDGVVRDGPPLRSLGAAAVYRNCPKFGATHLNPTENSANSSQEDKKQYCENVAKQPFTPKNTASSAISAVGISTNRQRE